MSDENLEGVVSEPVVNEAEIENVTTDESTNEAEQADNTQQTDAIDPIKSAQERAGKKIAAQRKLYAEQVERLKQENEQLKQRQAAIAATQTADGQKIDPSRLIYDAKTERYFDIDSPIGEQVWREQEAEKKSKIKESQRIYEQTAEKIMQGQAVYDDFDDALTVFQANGTNDIATALVGSEDPAKLVHYLGNNPNELSRLTQLSPMQIQREVVKLEMALQNTKKLVTNAPAPVNHLREPKNKTVPHEAMSYEDRAKFWNDQINRET